MKTKLFFVPALIAALFLTSLCTLFGCSESNNDDIDNSVPAVSEEVEEDETNKVQNESETEVQEPTAEDGIIEEPVVLFRNPLTGLACDENLVNKRPVAMMINNIKQAIPQLGISNADIMYECIVEGGITRLMCVFSDYENLPVVGSVRSSRDYYIDIAQSHDAIYAHCGGSEDAYSTIAERNIDNIDGVRGSYAAASAYWKDQDRVRNMGYEHASMTNGEKLSLAIANLNYRTAITENFSHPLKFSEEYVPFDGAVAESVIISYSGKYSRSFFEFDKDAGVYKKGQYGAAHTDANTNEVLTFDNLIILGVTYKDTGDSYHHLVMDFTGEGKGYYVCKGALKDIIWKKPDRQSAYSLYEADGTTPLILNPGKSYIGLANGLGQVTFGPLEESTIE